MRILVCGDRNWSDFNIIKRELSKYPNGTIIIEGDCRGADNIGEYIAKQLGFEVIKFPANWEKYGKSAGPIRNRQMLIEGKPDLILAFHSNIQNSRGTKNMIETANKSGIKIILIDK